MARARRGRTEGSIYQRESDGRWVATLSQGVVNGKRKRRTVYGDSKGEVQKKLAKLQADAGTLTDPGSTTLASYLDRWLADAVKPARTPNTYRSYEMTVRLHINEHIGGVRLDKLRGVQVQALYSEMERKGASPRLRQLTHAVLRRALAQAVKWGLIQANPCSGAERPTVAKKELVTLTPEQTRQLLRVAEAHRLSALFVLAVATGMRQGELFGLRWSDVDLEGMAVTVCHTLEEIDGAHRLKEPKSKAGRRRIDLPAFAVAALVEHRKKMMAEGHAAAPVFCDHKGGWLRKSNFVRQIFKPMLKKAGLPDIRFHDLRHGHATWLLSLGEHPKVVQERLGHAQIALTLDVYSHVLPTVQRKAADSLNTAFRQTV